MSIKVYCINETNKIYYGVRKRKKYDFSETLNFLKGTRFRIFKILFKIPSKYFNVYFTNTNENYDSKMGLLNSALRGINIFVISK
jgi:hypothetical protein